MIEKQQTPEPPESAVRRQVLVVTSDPQRRKWLAMALSLEFACSVHTADSASRAEAAVRRLTPALLVIDEQFLIDNAVDLAARLHNIARLEHLPTLFLTVSDLSQNGHHRYPTRLLAPTWNVESLYAAVRSLLAETA
jgi:CheY-like chemotaxis protein